MSVNVTIYPTKLRGTLQAIPSKSHAHRLLICAAFADKPTHICCPKVSGDMEATIGCLEALGAGIHRTATGFVVSPVSQPLKNSILDCRESGSTLRFLLPVAAAFHADCTFLLRGSLARRPIAPLLAEMNRHGCTIRVSDGVLRCQGRLQSGDYRIPGNISSQFISGLLLAFPFMSSRSTITVTDRLESRPYVEMTLDVMRQFGLHPDGLSVTGVTKPLSPGSVSVEGDWSCAAFYLAATALGSDVAVNGLREDSLQGDKAILPLLSSLDEACTIDASDIPDLVPILAVAAAAGKGAVFTGVSRLRLKESDRIESTVSMLKSLGISAAYTENALTVSPGAFTGGTVDSMGDHRVAMSAAIAATAASGPVTILNAGCTEKSYPQFWDDYRSLGGQYEFDIR